MFMKTSLFALGLTASVVDSHALSQKLTTSQTSDTTIEASKIKVIDFKTPKGLTGWFVETKDIPVLSVSICFKNAGSKADPKEKIGLSLFLEGALNEGCGSYDSAAFKKHLLEHNINFSIDQSGDVFTLAFRVPQNSIKEAFRLLKLILTEPRFDSTPLERVKHQLLTILHQSLHSENAVAGDLMNQRAFAGHPYSHSIAETIEGMSQLTPEDLRQFMKSRFTKDQLVITAAGGINQQNLSELLDEMLGDLPETATPLPINDIDIISSGNIFVQTMDIPQSAIIFFQPGISRKDPDFYAAFILNKILGEGAFDTRLWDEVREKRGLAYGISTTLSWVDHSNYILGATATQNENVKQVIDIILKEWKNIHQNGVTAQELQFIKNKAMGSYPLAFGSTYQIVSILRIYQLDGLGPNFINERNNMLEKVTIEDVNRVAKTLLIPEKLTFIVVGKPDGFNSGEQ